MSYNPPLSAPLLTPAEVATMFRVDPKTVTRWAKAGKLTSIRTLGGHRRYREAEVRSLLNGVPYAPAQPAVTVSAPKAAQVNRATATVVDWRPGLTARTITVEETGEGPVVVERLDGRYVAIVKKWSDLPPGTSMEDTAADLAVEYDVKYAGSLA